MTRDPTSTERDGDPTIGAHKLAPAIEALRNRWPIEWAERHKLVEAVSTIVRQASRHAYAEGLRVGRLRESEQPQDVMTTERPYGSRGRPGAVFYVRDKRTVVGNCALWWCEAGGGYTCDLDRAGHYTAKELEGMRDSDVPYLIAEVDTYSVRHCRFDVQSTPKPARPSDDGTQ